MKTAITAGVGLLAIAMSNVNPASLPGVEHNTAQLLNERSPECLEMQSTEAFRP